MNYIGVKLIKAEGMTRLEYNVYRGWELPEDENGSDPGFLVEYLDGGAANMPGRDGYVSWSPEEVFKNAYRKVDGLSFGLAIEAMKKGLRVARKGWNGKEMFLYLDSFKETNSQVNEEGYKYEPCIAMFTADKKWQPGWLASQTDILSEDWEVID